MKKYLVLYLLFILASPLMSTKQIKEFTSIKKIPKMVILDLDNTMWPFRVDDQINSPFHRNDLGQIQDTEGKIFEPYPESLKVLKYLRMNHIIICTASRTEDNLGAEQLIKLFGWSNLLKSNQIYPGSKRRHINTLSRHFKIELKDILYFDDEYHNIVDLEHMGVVSILVNQGMTIKVLMDGLHMYSHRRLVDKLAGRPSP